MESSKFIDTINVHIPSLEKTISSSDGINPLKKDWELSLEHLKAPESSGLTFDRGRIFMDMQYPLNIPDEKQPLFIMEISLSNPEILKMLEGFNQYPDSSIYLTNTDGHFMLSTNPNLPKPDSNGKYSREFEATHVITTSTLNAAGMRLFSIVPTEHIYGKISAYRWFFLFYVILAVVTIIIFGLLIHRMIHRPVGSLIQAIHRVENGDYSTTLVSQKEDEFHYLNQAFNKMTQKSAGTDPSGL